LASDLKIDPQYLNDIPDLKPSQNDVAVYNSSFARMPESEKTELKAIFAERGKLVQKHHADKKELLRLKYQWYMQDYMACVASIDENVGRLLNYLDSTGLSKNTIVMYTGDQGFYLGENGWFDKRWMYDVSMQAPLLMRWPGKIKAGSINSDQVQNIDFAPTMLDIAETAIPDWMQGISLKKQLLSNTPLQREYLYYHYYEYPIDHYVAPHLGVRSKNFKLVYFYTHNEWEFYDLKKDPTEQKNLIKSTAHAKEIARYKTILNQLRDQYDDHEVAGELK
ncbi:MAG: DUF4976 domain-containing protein, partial [Chitinophagaceae bacterium]|nr:DUF4976 domain-containing protein [Chitinophagaceae bacterium]